MNCVQCGEALPASAKFCKKCGCQVSVPISQPSSAASPRGLPAAPTPAYTTCPDCGALSKGNAGFCNKCGCRFEDKPNFDDTKRDWDTPLTAEEERAILVFGNVQDSSEPASPHQGERIDTSPAMVIGGAAAMAAAAVPAPSLRPLDAPAVPQDADWLVSSKSATAPVGKPVPHSPPAAPIPAPAPAPKRVKPAAKTDLNPMPVDPVSRSAGNGPWIALGVLALAVLVGGGAWWWTTQGKVRNVTTTAPAPAPAPVPVTAPEPAVTPLPAESVLAPNESMVPAAPVVAPNPVVVEEVPSVAAGPVENASPRPAPAPRKPARKQTLDDLLN